MKQTLSLLLGLCTCVAPLAVVSCSGNNEESTDFVTDFQFVTPAEFAAGTTAITIDGAVKATFRPTATALADTNAQSVSCSGTITNLGANGLVASNVQFEYAIVSEADNKVRKARLVVKLDWATDYRQSKEVLDALGITPPVDLADPAEGDAENPDFSALKSQFCEPIVFHIDYVGSFARGETIPHIGFSIANLVQACAVKVEAP